MKITIIIAILLASLGVGLAIRYNQSASGAQKDLDQERYLRMTAEENLEKANQRVNSLGLELEQAKEQKDKILKDLAVLKSAADDYKSRLDQAAEINKSLEAKIQEVQSLVTPQAGMPAAQ